MIDTRTQLSDVFPRNLIFHQKSDVKDLQLFKETQFHRQNENCSSLWKFF
jgi:hypothetical protein